MFGADRAFTKKDLVAMWQRPVEEQYHIAQAKMLEAIRDTDGDISISFSGGKDSSLLLDMYVLYVVEDITGTVTDPYHYKVHFYTALPDVDVNK